MDPQIYGRDAELAREHGLPIHIHASENRDQADTDGDGQGDACDSESGLTATQNGDNGEAEVAQD